MKIGVFAHLTKRPKYIMLLVEDDGTGFDLSDANYKGIGLSNIKNRTELLNGTIQWESGRDEGTMVLVKVPI